MTLTNLPFQWKKITIYKMIILNKEIHKFHPKKQKIKKKMKKMLPKIIIMKKKIVNKIKIIIKIMKVNL